MNIVDGFGSMQLVVTNQNQPCLVRNYVSNAYESSERSQVCYDQSIRGDELEAKQLSPYAEARTYIHVQDPWKWPISADHHASDSFHRFSPATV